jgi:hypothetical protein
VITTPAITQEVIQVSTIPQWLWLLLLLPMNGVMTVWFVLAVGIIQGLTTGRYPSLSQWSTALRDLQQPVGQETGPSSCIDDEPATPVRHRQPRRGSAQVPRRR